MSELLLSKIRMAARQLASDAEICRICGITPERLERYRSSVEAARAETMVSLKYERAKLRAQRPPKDGKPQ
jgi:hypothetical protein